MDVVVATHQSSLEHDTGRTHPERPERIAAFLQGIRDSELPIVEIESPEILRSDLALVHDPEYIEMIQNFCSLGGGALDMDTIASSATWTAALTSAGGVKATVEALADMEDATGFVVARPPGHHAMRDRAMGFCFFNNVAVTGALLRSRGSRVAILDWDVHHGNGTQAMLGDDPGVLYASIHQSPFYPFEGEVSDIDSEGAKGTTVNIPLPAGTGGDVIRRAWEEIIIPVVRSFEPDWNLVSAGYDGHAVDPLAEFRMMAWDYGWLAKTLAEVHAPNRIVSVLEGGYDLDALRLSARGTVLGYAGVEPDGESLGSPPDSTVALEAAKSAIAAHWPL